MLNEDDVVSAVCSYLEMDGYTIIQKCSTTQKGIDIIAGQPGGNGRLLIEAKGGTSSRVGSSRYRLPFTTSQVFDRVSKGFYTAVCTYSTHKKTEDKIGLAFPDTPVFRRYLEPLRSMASQIDLTIYLVKEDRSLADF